MILFQAARGDQITRKTDVWGAVMVCLCLLTDGTPLLSLLCPKTQDRLTLRGFVSFTIATDIQLIMQVIYLIILNPTKSLMSLEINSNVDCNDLPLVSVCC